MMRNTYKTPFPKSQLLCPVMGAAWADLAHHEGLLDPAGLALDCLEGLQGARHVPACAQACLVAAAMPPAARPLAAAVQPPAQLPAAGLQSVQHRNYNNKRRGLITGAFVPLL